MCRSVTYLLLTFTHYVHFMHTLFTNMDEYLNTTLEFGMSLYTLLSWNSQVWAKSSLFQLHCSPIKTLIIPCYQWIKWIMVNIGGKNPQFSLLSMTKGES